MNVLIFGAGENGTAVMSYFRTCRSDDILIGFLDNKKKGNVDGIPIYTPSAVSKLDFDLIIISHAMPTVEKEIKSQLLSLGCSPEKIKSLISDKKLQTEVFANYVKYNANDRRVQFLKDYATFVQQQGWHGSVAECGVNKGDFAYWINTYFPNEKLYLFDTFEGFDSRDIATERMLGNESFLKGKFNSLEVFKTTNVELVRRKMPFANKCIFKKGFFPQTAQDVDDMFLFVMLDMDLYQPMYEGIKLFYPNMQKGGIILLHDYFEISLPGVKQAVEDYEQNFNVQLKKLPIGDGLSLAIIK